MINNDVAGCLLLIFNVNYPVTSFTPFSTPLTTIILRHQSLGIPLFQLALFNTLNSIYALAIRQDERTADTIVMLSEFMRYIIRDAHLDKVALAKEINYIANYIDLQKARFRDAVQN